MLLQELIPSGAVLQVWKTITFRDYDSSVLKRNIPTLNPSYITWASWDPCPLALWEEWEAGVEGRWRAWLCVAEVAGEVALPDWVVVVVLGSRNKWFSGCYRSQPGVLVCVDTGAHLCWTAGVENYLFFVPLPWGWCLPQGGRSGNQKYGSFRLLLLNSMPCLRGRE